MSRHVNSTQVKRKQNISFSAFDAEYDAVADPGFSIGITGPLETLTLYFSKLLELKRNLNKIKKKKKKNCCKSHDLQSLVDPKKCAIVFVLSTPLKMFSFSFFFSSAKICPKILS